MKSLLKSTILLIFFLAIFSSCDSIENTAWKYRDGFHIGDGITFDSSFIIKNDTIFSNEIPIAIFVETEFRISDRLLIIKELNGDSKGVYCSK
ncbi:hypothetical protein [Tenacibaculum dicentrarchi]|uniref:hypothetical protein n=1 Tax=Tenacibaculum dicentrarchi TaxID=669041 RepID=UPI000C638C76|nr:conserved exported hypothetical protein [Tenacibaculum dicentrarchi]SOU87324.1 conserved exported hypothetical protein [Tenacibaculum dicentrarchi]